MCGTGDKYYDKKMNESGKILWFIFLPECHHPATSKKNYIGMKWTGGDKGGWNVVKMLLWLFFEGRFGN